MISRIIYLGYYILKTPKTQFYKYFNFVKKEKKISSLSLYWEILCSSLKYNISFIDYFKLRFFNKTSQEREEYVGAGFMYKYQLKMNPLQSRDVLESKIKFLTRFNEFSGRKWATFKTLQENPELLQDFLKNEKGKVVLKYSKGQSGKEVNVVETANITPEDLLNLMKNNKYDLIETFVTQHDYLMNIAPRGLNTVRMVTQLINNNDVQIIGASLRLSIYKSVDNMGAGNMVLPLDLETGKTTGKGIYVDITKEDPDVHPLTGCTLTGITVPYWQECKNIVLKAALLTPENKSIGWDIAVTNNGPLLIEGNHNWNHDSLQLPLRKGFKKILSQFL